MIWMASFPKHILETQQFKEGKLIENLFSLASEMELFDTPLCKLSDEQIDRSEKLVLPCKPRTRVLANLFYEPSTRTRFSFSSAMKSLGGDTIETESAGHFSSAAKGETLPDTIRITSGYADVIVLRHPKEGAAKQAARYSSVPIINAGDGTGQHPTQALLDLYTIKKELGRIDDLKIAMVGDLKQGRTVHSLAYLLAHRDKMKMYFVSPEQLKMRQDIIQYFNEKHIDFEELADMKDIARVVDVLYMTRIQKERFGDNAEYEKVKDAYVLDERVLDLMPLDSIVMHPLPRVNEISPSIDGDRRAAYFRQAINGKYVRMALLKMLLDPPAEYI